MELVIAMKDGQVFHVMFLRAQMLVIIEESVRKENVNAKKDIREMHVKFNFALKIVIHKESVLIINVNVMNFMMELLVIKNYVKKIVLIMVFAKMDYVIVIMDFWDKIVHLMLVQMSALTMENV